MEESYIISTTMLHPRTFHVEIFLRVIHPQGYCKEGEIMPCDIAKRERMQWKKPT